MNHQPWKRIDSPIGELTLVGSERGLAQVRFASDDRPLDGPEASGDTMLETAAEQITEYFDGKRREFDLPLDLVGTDFQRQAWMALADVPYGETVSYAKQAESIGRPGAFRAVGAANGKNPVPIVLPCHRVVGSDGSLTGFAGGTDRKQALLSLEKHNH